MLNWDSVKRRVLNGRMLLVIASVLVGFCGIAAWIVEPPLGWPGIVVSAVYIVAVFALPFGGRYAAWVIVVAACIDELSPDIVGTDEGMGLILGMLLLGYLSHHWFDALALALIAASSGYDMYWFPEDAGYVFPQGAIGMALSYGIPYCCGIILWQRQILYKAQKNRERLEACQRNIALASRIHESVSGNLARIMLETQRLATEEDAGLRRGVTAIRRDAGRALRDVHAVIDYLDDDGDHTRKEISWPAYMNALESVVHSGDRRLHSQGFQGRSIIHGICEVPTDGRCMLSLEVLREAYANIEKHADRQLADYRINVAVDERRFMLSQTNSCVHAEDWNEPPQSGRGLKLLAKRVRACGGEMRWNEDDEVWSLYCVLPLVGQRNTQG